MTSLRERLFTMQDKQYAAFQAKLTPGVPMESFIGIRVPVLRKFAKEFTKEKECEEFLHQLPHQYYDENMLHGLLISEVKDYEECIRLTDKFLPFVDNWAVCDIMSQCSEKLRMSSSWRIVRIVRTSASLSGSAWVMRLAS